MYPISNTQASLIRLKKNELGRSKYSLTGNSQFQSEMFSLRTFDDYQYYLIISILIDNRNDIFLSNDIKF